MTGLYPVDAGMPFNYRNLPPDLQSIAEMVSDDYHTGYVGKWHLGDESSVESHPPFTGPYKDLYDAATLPVDDFPHVPRRSLALQPDPFGVLATDPRAPGDALAL